MQIKSWLSAAAVALAAVLILGGCAGGTPADQSAPNAAEGGSHFPVTVTDMAGNEVTIKSADAVAITDNRFFQLAADWGLPVVVAPVDLMSPNNPLKKNTAILNTGTHNEPDFEQVVAANPDVIINGYRYGGDNAADMKAAAPDAAFVDMDGPEDQNPTEYVTQSITLLGQIFDKADEAKALIDEFNASVATAKESYNPDTSVMGLLTSGNEISYSNPYDGRGASVFFTLLDLTPALDSKGSKDHTGDSISLEAIAQANADVFMVLDRDAAVSDGESTPALELINGSAALANVPAVRNKAIYVLPPDYYLTEDVYAYIAVLEGLTTVFKAQ